MHFLQLKVNLAGGNLGSYYYYRKIMKPLVTCR